MKLNLKHIVTLCIFFPFAAIIHAGPAEDAQLLKSIRESNIPEALTAIEKGADVKAKDDSDNTALILAANIQNTAFNKELNIKLFKKLLEKGADIVDAENKQGQRALTFAAYYGGDIEKVKLLIDSGANTTFKDMSGKTVLDRVLNNEVKKLILQAQAKK